MYIILYYMILHFIFLLMILYQCVILTTGSSVFDLHFVYLLSSHSSKHEAADEQPV